MKYPSVVSLLEGVMNVDSTTGSEEAVGVWMDNWFKNKGYHVYRQYLEGSNSRFNILATPQSWSPGEPGPAILFNSHMDTVPPFIPPTIHEKEGVIRGRGSCDAKGVFASMIIAALDLPEHKNDIGFLWLVGEEVDHSGAVHSVKLNLSPKAVVCGEPTECKMITSQKGGYKVTLRTTGLAGHSGYPEVGKSAVDPLVKMLGDILNEEWPVDADMGPTTVNIGVIKGGVAANVIPAHAEAEVLFRLVTPTVTIEDRVKSIVDNRAQIDAQAATAPFKFHTIEGFDTMPVSYGTDVPFMGFQTAPKFFLYGPGSIKVAHSKDEYCSFADIDTAVDAYKTIIKYVLTN